MARSSIETPGATLPPLLEPVGSRPLRGSVGSGGVLGSSARHAVSLRTRAGALAASFVSASFVAASFVAGPFAAGSFAAAVGTASAAPARRAPAESDGSTATTPSRAYCEYVTHVAASEGALLRAPWLFSSFGTLRGTASPDADAALGPDADRELSLRLQAGVGFSPTRYYLAGLLEDQAEAECERRRAEDEIRAYGTSGQLVTQSALLAKVEVLEAALPEAERRLQQSLDALEASRTTLQEHGALERRVDELRERRASAELELAALPEVDGSGTPPAGSFERLRRWTAAKQSAASSVRRAAALSLTLRGGYDELLGVAQDLPVFGSITLEFNPGWFWQSGHDERAERAHAEAVAAEVLGQTQSLAAVARRLEAQLVILRRRRSEVKTSLAELNRRQQRLEAAGSPTAREYAEHVWFEEVRLRADAAYLTEQVQTLERMTGSRASDGDSASDDSADREPGRERPRSGGARGGEPRRDRDRGSSDRSDPSDDERER